MFRNRKLVIRLEKDDARTNETVTREEPKTDYVAVAENAIKRIGPKLLVGLAATLVVTAVVSVAANAADTAIQNALTTE